MLGTEHKCVAIQMRRKPRLHCDGAICDGLVVSFYPCDLPNKNARGLRWFVPLYVSTRLILSLSRGALLSPTVILYQKLAPAVSRVVGIAQKNKLHISPWYLDSRRYTPMGPRFLHKNFSWFWSFKGTRNSKYKLIPYDRLFSAVNNLQKNIISKFSYRREKRAQRSTSASVK